MDLYIFCVVLGAAGMAAMALLGFASSHGGGHHSHDTAGHEMHGAGGHSHSVSHAPITHGHVHAHNVEAHALSTLKHYAWSWLSPRVMFNFLVGFGATGLVAEKIVGPFLALPIAFVGGLAFETLVVRPLFNSLFRFESQPAQTLESAIMSDAKAVTGFDSNGNGLVVIELGGEVVHRERGGVAAERKGAVLVGTHPPPRRRLPRHHADDRERLGTATFAVVALVVPPVPGQPITEHPGRAGRGGDEVSAAEVVHRPA